MKLRFAKGTAMALTAASMIAGAVSIGGYKRHVENSMPINYSHGECRSMLELATQLEMREVPFSWGKRYNVVVKGERVGTVCEEVFNWGKKFNFYAGSEDNGEYLGHAQEKISFAGHKSTVYNELNQEIGRLDEVVISMNPGHLIEAYDEDGNKIAISDERALSWAHTTDIFDTGGNNQVGLIEKSYFWDDYTATINSDIDRRILLALIAMEDKLDDERDRKKSDNARKNNSH